MKTEMKDSGIDWIGEIPVRWDVCRIKNILVNGKDGIKIGPFGSSLTNKVGGDGEYKIYGQWNIVNKDFSAGKNYINEDTFRELSSYKIVAGDILVSMMGTIGKCAIIPNNIQQGIMDSHVIKIRLSELINPVFFEYLYDKDNSGLVFEQLNRVKKGSIMDGLNSTIVKNLTILLPPKEEQSRIANFLDKKCAEIDELIALQEQMIAQLTTYKQAVITETVTKGLDPNVKMKDSGVEWIGEIPEHWEIGGMKNVCRQNTNYMSEKEDANLIFDYVDIGSVSFEKGIFKTETYSFKNAPSRARRKASLGDFIMSTVRTYLRAMDVIDTKEKAAYIYSTGFAILTPLNHMDYNFLSFISKNQYFLEQVKLSSKGINYPSINAQDLMSIKVVYPPLSEQQSIANYLDQKCKEIDELISIKKEKIEQLKAYKKSVIYEYVTGKKQVEIDNSVHTN